MTSQHTAPDGFSPLFSNAAADHHSPVAKDAASATVAETQKRSELHGDHHLTFVDVADSDARPSR